MRIIGALLLAFALSSCAPRGTITVDPAAASIGQSQRVFIATSRLSAAGAERFGSDRAPLLGFAAYDISIPPDRVEGEVRFPRGKPDPQRDMVAISERRLQEPQFRADLGLAMASAPVPGRAVVFIHGFNTTYAEGIYRAAQMVHDLGPQGAVVHFAWPSLANPLGYVYDRDSVLFARDGLERTLDHLVAAGATDIVLLAHSMGAQLAMETLRQAEIRGNDRLLDRIDAVVLVSPDIDVDVFRSQMSALDPVPEPFVVFGSRRDGFLRASAFLSGETARLGSLPDTTVLADLPVTFIDVTAFRDGTMHFPVATSPELLVVLDRLVRSPDWLRDERFRTSNPLSAIIVTTQEATRIVLSPLGGTIRRRTLAP